MHATTGEAGVLEEALGREKAPLEAENQAGRSPHSSPTHRHQNRRRAKSKREGEPYHHWADGSENSLNREKHFFSKENPRAIRESDLRE